MSAWRPFQKGSHGTLLSPDHTLSPYAKETLKLLTARGIHFVFATGRHHVDVGQ
ncbi:HAD hydrolase family protein, partial [Salmonella enterica]|uniref:HAD hydrolase family protein n=1 Tax=Salmonella enterica TaxID=28901 RepID=UPI0015941B71